MKLLKMLFSYHPLSLFVVCLKPDQSKENIHNGGLIELYGKIQKAVEDITSNSGSSKCITIILDDFSLIEVAAKGSFNHSLDFLRYCCTLTSEAVRCQISFLVPTLSFFLVCLCLSPPPLQVNMMQVDSYYITY